MEVNVYNSDALGDRGAGIVAVVYADNDTVYPLTVLENIQVPEGVDTPYDEWYSVKETPQYIVDHINENLRPVVDAFSRRN